jgi:DNA-binding transcriptional LysR family regulator
MGQPNLVGHLAAFIAVVEHGGLTAAARELRCAVSSVSYSLTQLEAYCGFPLLDRGRKRAQLTDRGRALFSEAKSVVERAQRFSSHAASLEKGEESRLRILVDVLFPRTIINRALTVFAQAHPRVRVQLFNSSLATLWGDLRGDTFEFGLSLLTAMPSDMEGRTFAVEKLGPICAASHPLARIPPPLPMSAFQTERQVYYVGSPEIDMERVGRLLSTDVWSANDVELIRQLVCSGVGWCFSGPSSFDEELRAGLVRRLECVDAQFHPVRALGVAWPVNRRPGTLGRALIAIVSEYTQRVSETVTRRSTIDR